MANLDAVKEAIAQLQGYINEADGRDMVAKRKPPESTEEAMETEGGEETAPAVVVEVDEEGAEAKPPMSDEERRKLIGY